MLVSCGVTYVDRLVVVFFLMIRRPPRSTRTTHSFPTRRSSDLEVDRDHAERDHENAEEGHHPRHGAPAVAGAHDRHQDLEHVRSEEHTSELQSLMRISYAVFCLKKKTQQNNQGYTVTNRTTKSEEISKKEYR